MDPTTPQPVSSTPPMNMSAPSHSKWVWILISIALFLLIVFVVMLYVVFNPSKKSAQQQPSTNSKTSQVQQKLNPNSIATAKGFPTVSIDVWDVKSATISAPSSASVYEFKQNLTVSDFRDLASNFFKTSTIDEKDGSITGSSTGDDGSVLYFQKPTGSFLYRSFAGIDLPKTGGVASEESQVNSFVRNLMSDRMLKVTAQFTKKDQPGAKFYEVHRDWKAAGMPIFNLFGLFNIPATQALQDLTLNTVMSNTPKDVNIIDTSDNSDGLKRPNDFNTLTIGIRDGKIFSIVSNIRKIKSGVLNVQQLISYDKAVEKLKNNEYTQIYTAPTGSGTVSYDKMYPNQKAQFTSATVSEAALAYLEDLPKDSQTSLQPFYVFRGSGKLVSGYDVNFVAAVPASAQKVLGASTTRDVLLAQAGTATSSSTTVLENTSATTSSTGDNGQKQGTLGGDKPNLQPANCTGHPTADELTDVVKDDNGFIFGKYSYTWSNPSPLNPNGGNPTETDWWVVTDQNWDLNKLNDAIDAALAKLGLLTYDQAVIRHTQTGVLDYPTTLRENVAKMIDDFNTHKGCPVRITGASPSIFAYNIPQTGLIVQPKNVLYSNPSLQNNQWNFVNGMINGQNATYAYYEYQKVSFNKPQVGWIVNKNKLNNFAATIAQKLQLTSKEQDRLVFELNNAAAEINSSSLFIGLVDRPELDIKVPLITSQVPNHTYRIHFYISSATSTQKSVEPVLAPIKRDGFTLLELGSYSGK